MRIRLELERDRNLVVPDEYVKWDKDDAFGYIVGDTIVGWNRNVETFWRERSEQWPNEQERLELDKLVNDEKVGL